MATNAGVEILYRNDHVAAFTLRHPNGYVIVNGDRGIGLTGAHADTASNMGGDVAGWIRFAAILAPYIHAAADHDGVA